MQTTQAQYKGRRKAKKITTKKQTSHKESFQLSWYSNKTNIYVTKYQPQPGTKVKGEEDSNKRNRPLTTRGLK